MDTIENQENGRRLRLSIMLSIAAYFVWMSIWGPPPQGTVIVPDQNVEEKQEAKASPLLSEDIEAKAVEKEPPVQEIKPHKKDWKTKDFKAVVSSNSGAIQNIILNDFTELPQNESWWGWIFDGMKGSWDPYSGGDKELSILSQNGSLMLAGVGEKVDIDSTCVVKASKDDVVATCQEENLKIVKTYRHTDIPFVFELDIEFINQSDDSLSNLWVGISDEMSGDVGRFLDGIRPQIYVDESVETYYELDDLDEEIESFDLSPGWFGLGSRYFMVASMIKDNAKRSELRSISVMGFGEKRYGSVAYLSHPLDAGATRKLEFISYVGPKNLDILESLGPEWAEAIEFGIFGFFSRVLLFLLKIFYSGFNNWGIAILMLTLLVKLIFFPLTQKAFMSGKKMQALQPQIKELKEKYKDNQQLQAQETMKLFQKHGTSPLGGCLPSLIQIPVWFALYNVMLYSVELYDSSFLYLEDLTSVDPFGVLPLIYAVLMILQQRMMPMANMDPTQQKVMKMMPLVFGLVIIPRS